jgi:hypothetical protein
MSEALTAIGAATALEKGWTMWDDENLPGRACRSCTLCCTLLPVDLYGDEYKPATTRCRFQKHDGCGVYADRPRPCRVWSCRWLFDPLTKSMRRPDHAGYVIDAMLDTVAVNGHPVNAVQVWCDPARPEAWRDPQLRAYLDEVVKRFEIVVLVRFGSSRAICLLPPGLTGEPDWVEQGGDTLAADKMLELLAEAGLTPKTPDELAANYRVVK